MKYVIAALRYLVTARSFADLTLSLYPIPRVSVNFNPNDPHQGQPVLRAGADLSPGRPMIILLHGRGGSAEDVVRLAHALRVDHASFCAPQAHASVWYPRRFLAPVAANEPWLSSALDVVNGLIDESIAAGVPRDAIFLGGFSQGACLALETAVRRGGHFGGVFALSGAVIGFPGAPRPLDQQLDGTRVLVACSDVDDHIPLESVRETTRVLKGLGAKVTERIFPGMGHIISPEEIELVRRMLAAS